jgi:ribosome biogenesis GTPase A
MHCSMLHASGSSSHDHVRTQVKQKYLDKGQSKRIWAELYKVVDSSDVVIQVRPCSRSEPPL